MRIVAHVSFIAEIVSFKKFAKKGLVVILRRESRLLVISSSSTVHVLWTVVLCELRRTLRPLRLLLPLRISADIHRCSSTVTRWPWLFPLIHHLPICLLFLLLPITLVRQLRLDKDLLVCCLRHFVLRYRLLRFRVKISYIIQRSELMLSMREMASVLEVTVPQVLPMPAYRCLVLPV